MKKPYVMLLSLLLQIVGLGALTLLPLIHPQVLPIAQLRTVLAAPAPPRAVPRPLAERSVKVFARPLDANQLRLFAPRVTPRQVNPVENIASAPDVGIPDGIPAATGTSEVLRNLLAIVPVAPPPPPVIKKMPAGPVHVSSGVVESNLIHRVQPAYPALAKSARVQGTVEFTAIISKQGTIQNLQLVRGHPLLVNAARAAILQWQYRPTLLNGEPVEVITDIVVNFTLSQ